VSDKRDRDRREAAEQLLHKHSDIELERDEALAIARLRADLAAAMEVVDARRRWHAAFDALREDGESRPEWNLRRMSGMAAANRDERAALARLETVIGARRV
jgi:hypothetical protein